MTQNSGLELEALDLAPLEADRSARTTALALLELEQLIYTVTTPY